MKIQPKMQRDPIRTRKQSSNQERRNSVSDIKDYFQAKTRDCNYTSPMPPRKISGKKDKERNRELRETHENIKTMIKNLGKEDSENQSTEEELIASANTNGASHVEAINERSNEIPLEKETVNAETQTSEDEMLSAINELLDKYKKLEETVEHPRNGLSVQLAKTKETVSQLYSDINGAVSGLKVQMAKVREISESNTASIKSIMEGRKKMASLVEENKKLVQELKVMQGLLQKVSQQSIINSNQLLDLTKRGMEQNLIIHGIDDSVEIEDARAEEPMFTYKEQCRESVSKFFTQVMNLSFESGDIWKAHRMGPKKENKVKPMVVKLSYGLKDLVMEHVSSLKGQQNAKTGQKYFISEQIPEGIVEKKKQVSNRLKHLRDDNDKKAKEQRSKIQLINDTILADEKIDTPEITTPQPSQLFLDPKSQAMIDAVQQEMVESEPVIIRNSEFVGLAAKVQSLEKIQKLYIAAIQRYPSADHAMMAYAFWDDLGTVKTGFCDDREFGAGSRLRKTLFEMQRKDTVVFVLRKYGGVHLGFNRFAAIEKTAKDALDML